MDIENLFSYIILDRENLLIKGFSKCALSIFPHMEVGDRVLKYCSKIDFSRPSQKVIIDGRNFNITINHPVNPNEEIYLINIIEENDTVDIKQDNSSYDLDPLEDAIDEFDSDRDGYSERVQIFSQSLINKINTAEKVLIMGHKYPDLDSFASGLGIYEFVKYIDIDKPCNIVLDDVTTSISTLYEKVIETEKYEGVVVFEDNKKAEPTENTLLIIVDVDNPHIVASPKVLEDCKNIVILDHHRKSKLSIDASLKLHLFYASSTSELVTKVLRTVCKVNDFTCFLAEALLAGIIIDTKSFAIQTTYETFEVAGFLKQVGVNSKRVRLLLQGKLVDYKIKAQIVNKSNIYDHNVAISVVSLKPEKNPKLIISMGADELLTLEGVEVAFVIAQVEGDVFVSARSLGSNVAKVMQQLGGGGHLTAAATIVKETSAKEVKEQIMHIIAN